VPFVLDCFQASAAPRPENSDSDEKDALFGRDTQITILDLNSPRYRKLLEIEKNCIYTFLYSIKFHIKNQQRLYCSCYSLDVRDVQTAPAP
jgi:hypothetical protein